MAGQSAKTITLLGDGGTQLMIGEFATAVEMKANTPGGLTGKEAATGPLMFQGDHGAVAFRNIKVTALK